MLRRIDICVEKGRKCHCRGDTYDGCQCEHETNHDTCKVARNEGIDDDEDVLVTEVAEAQEDASGEEEIEEIELRGCFPPHSHLRDSYELAIGQHPLSMSSSYIPAAWPRVPVSNLIRQRSDVTNWEGRISQ
jgi:hypothetical protein